MPSREPSSLFAPHIELSPQNIEIRVACYERMLARYSFSEPLFVDATDPELQLLRKRMPTIDIRDGARSRYTRRKNIADSKTGEVGSFSYVYQIRIQGDTAAANFTFYADPEGAEYFRLHLQDEKGVWKVVSVESLGMS